MGLVGMLGLKPELLVEDEVKVILAWAKWTLDQEVTEMEED